jgi:purine-binding chemotaxis protein CheW
MSPEQITETNQYLTFMLSEEIFAIDIRKVREVLEYTTVTKVPRTPPFMRGVINLRGGVVPVVDMRLKFAMEATDMTVNTCIIIAEILIDDETTVLGMLADSVQEVIELEPSQVEPPPRMGTRLRTDFIRGMGKREGEFLIILDVDKVFSAEEIAVASTAQGKGQEMTVGA